MQGSMGVSYCYVRKDHKLIECNYVHFLSNSFFDLKLNMAQVAPTVSPKVKW